MADGVCVNTQYVLMSLGARVSLWPAGTQHTHWHMRLVKLLSLLQQHGLHTGEQAAFAAVQSYTEGLKLDLQCASKMERKELQHRTALPSPPQFSSLPHCRGEFYIELLYLGQDYFFLVSSGSDLQRA